MRKPRATTYTSPLPALVGAALLAMSGEASAQSTDAATTATDAATASDATADLQPPPPPPEYTMHTGGVPMRTGGDVPRHGACACDVPRASSDPRHLATVTAVLAALASRRRKANRREG